ncbi:MAG: SGNH/GDSL hydrolase family protein [Verrucomicrobiae bacterium]|nr:SGNH/GDSL hydrolase family protein [Verrucomicrobiae bacterium]
MRIVLLGMVFLVHCSLSWAQSGAPTKPVAPAPSKEPPVPADVAWHDVTGWGVEGRGWEDQERTRWFDRLPAKAEGKVTGAVWGLSRDSAGMMVRFRTDGVAIYARYKLLKDKLGMPHMPATGVSGLDLYARDGQGGWRWVYVTKPDKQLMEAAVVTDLAPGEREYAAYLPLYNGVESLEIGVPSGAKFEGLAPRREKPIVFYGTSITHGASASRPGMVHTAILGRRLDRPVINLGFSGNGRMDAAVGELMCELDAAAFVVDCLPNMDAKSVSERAAPLVRQLRAGRPGVPIILVEDRLFTNTWVRPSRQKFHADNHAALKKAFDELRAAGVGGLYYIPGDHLLGDDAEGATDASHPNDLGFMRQADAFEPVLREALGMR